MSIQEASRASGLPVKTIRYYEEVGLISPRRSANGYRQFDARDHATLGFLAHARDLGFSLEDCRALLALRAAPDRASADVKAIAQAHLDDIDRRIAAMEAMRSVLAGLVAQCAGDGGAACGILAGIEAVPEGTAAASPAVPLEAPRPRPLGGPKS